MEGKRFLEVSQLQVSLSDDAEEVGKDVELVRNVPFHLVDVIDQLLGIIDRSVVLIFSQHWK